MPVTTGRRHAREAPCEAPGNTGISRGKRGVRRRAPARRSRAHLRAQAGVTLIEVIIVLAILAIGLSVGLSAYSGYRDRVDVGIAVKDIQVAAGAIERFLANTGEYPATLAAAGFDRQDPWGNDYEYRVVADTPVGQLRKDKNLVPINSDFDLFSRGPNGVSNPPLTAATSQDDVVRASNGAFIGSAADY